MVLRASVRKRQRPTARGGQKRLWRPCGRPREERRRIGLITRRSRVRIPPPLPQGKPATAGFSRSLAAVPDQRAGPKRVPNFPSPEAERRCHSPACTAPGFWSRRSRFDSSLRSPMRRRFPRLDARGGHQSGHQTLRKASGVPRLVRIAPRGPARSATGGPLVYFNVARPTTGADQGRDLLTDDRPLGVLGGAPQQRWRRVAQPTP
jgi:hypothetical protein